MCKTNPTCRCTWLRNFWSSYGKTAPIGRYDWSHYQYINKGLASSIIYLRIYTTSGHFISISCLSDLVPKCLKFRPLRVWSPFQLGSLFNLDVISTWSSFQLSRHFNLVVFGNWSSLEFSHLLSLLPGERLDLWHDLRCQI